MAVDMSEVWSEIEETVMDLFPEVADGYRATQASRINWRDALARADIEPPFVVFRVLRTEPFEEFGLAKHHYSVGLEVFYIRSASRSSAEITAGTRAEDDLEAKMLALADALYHGAYDTFQVLEEWTVDCSDANDANLEFRETGAPYLAAAAYGSVVVWEGP